MTQRASLTILMENSVEPSETFTAPCLRTRESLFFFQRQIRMNCCFVHVKLNFTTLPVTLLPICFNFSAESPKLFWKHSFSKKLLKTPLDIWKTLLTFLEKIFVRIPKKFWPNFLKFFPGSFERTNLSSKDYIWRKEKLLKSLLKKLMKSRISSTQLKKMLKIKFSLKMISSKCSFWTRKLQFWETCQKNPPNIRYSFLSMFKKGKTHCLGKCFLRRSSRDIENIFVRDAKNIINATNISLKVLSFFQKMSQNDDWWNFTKKYCFDEKFAQGT